jgi:hypothetical protein
MKMQPQISQMAQIAPPCTDGGCHEIDQGSPSIFLGIYLRYLRYLRHLRLILTS